MENASPDWMLTLPPEMEALAPDAEQIRFHADQIRVNGFTVVENALPVPFIEELCARFDVLLEEHRRSVPTNRGTNRFQMYLPFEPPFASPMLYEHPVVLAIVEEILGRQIALGYFASDTPFPGSDYQATHADSERLFPETRLALPSFCLVANVPLVDVTEENGPIEIWPGGTHKFSDPVNIEKLAPTMVSQRLTMKAGGILIRDPLAWHRGTPNQGTRSRPNVALVYTRPWYRFALDPPAIRQAQFDTLSDKAKAMLRHAPRLDG